MTANSAATQLLLEQARQGDAQAVEQLLDRHRQRLKRMLTVRVDAALAARLDASDIVQETMITAAARLPDYLRGSDVAFYPWLRGIAWDRLVDLRRRHYEAQRRSVLREEAIEGELTDHSAVELAERFVTSATSPSRELMREELRSRVRAGLAKLTATDREVLILRYLEQLKFEEIAEVLQLSTKAVRLRHGRALERLREWLEGEFEEGQP